MLAFLVLLVSPRFIRVERLGGKFVELVFFFARLPLSKLPSENPRSPAFARISAFYFVITGLVDKSTSQKFVELAFYYALSYCHCEPLGVAISKKTIEKVRSRGYPWIGEKLCAQSYKE